MSKRKTFNCGNGYTFVQKYLAPMSSLIYFFTNLAKTTKEVIAIIAAVVSPMNCSPDVNAF
jgi:hypothetical protein